MPTISMFYLDNKNRNVPHIHAKYGEYSRVLSIPEDNILKGKMPNKKLKLGVFKQLENKGYFQ